MILEALVKSGNEDDNDTGQNMALVVHPHKDSEDIVHTMKIAEKEASKPKLSKAERRRMREGRREIESRYGISMDDSSDSSTDDEEEIKEEERSRKETIK